MFILNIFNRKDKCYLGFRNVESLANIKIRIFSEIINIYIYTYIYIQFASTQNINTIIEILFFLMNNHYIRVFQIITVMNV